MSEVRRSRWAWSLGRELCGKPVYVWLLWALAMPALAYAAVALADPALWMCAVDPELVAVIALAAGRQCRAEVVSLWRRASVVRAGARRAVTLRRRLPSALDERSDISGPRPPCADLA